MTVFTDHGQVPYRYVPANSSGLGHDRSLCDLQRLALANTPPLFQVCFEQTKRLKAWTSTLGYSGNQCPEQKQSSLVCSENRTAAVSVLGKKKKKNQIYYRAWQCICLAVVPVPRRGRGVKNYVGNRCRELECWSNFILCKVVARQCTFNWKSGPHFGHQPRAGGCRPAHLHTTSLQIAVAASPALPSQQLTVWVPSPSPVRQN